MSSSLVGRMLGNYKIIEKLGQGGMATVYIGYQESVGRRVAIKVLPPHPGMEADFVERFALEARTIAKLQHPHILPLFDYGKEDDILYLVAAFAEGGTLEDKMRAQPLDIKFTERILRQVAGAIDYAHRQGIIHRDIKPANVLLSEEGFAMLADFGIVKIMQEGGPDLTGTGVVGTPAYMAPEALQGDSIDSRADVYSLGVVAYQMLTGQQPITAPSMMQMMLKVIQEDPAPISTQNDSLPAALDVVFAKALAKDPAERHQTAAEFAEAFSAAINNTEALKAIRAAHPVSAADMPTAAMRTNLAADNQPTERIRDADQPLTPADTGNTIIVREGVSTPVILGVVGVIAAVIIAVVLIITGQSEDDPDSVADTPNTEIPTLPEAPTFGQVTFTDSAALGDTITLRVDDLAQPGDDAVYVAWLFNTENENTYKLGEVFIDGFGSGALTFTDPDGIMLPSLYNAVLITLEDDIDAEAPSDAVAYSGSTPQIVKDALRAIFIEAEDGLNGGSLLDGMVIEAETAARHAGLASTSTSVVSMQSHAEHTINILNGTQIDHDGDGRPVNPGRGVGVYAFASRISAQLDQVIEAPGVSQRQIIDTDLIRVCLDNSRIRADRVIELEEDLLAADTLAGVAEEAAESERIANEIVTGVDSNEDGTIDPFEGECGLDQIARFGLFVAGMQLDEGGLE